MNNLDDLRNRLGGVLQTEEQEHEHDQSDLERRMSELAIRRLRFSELAPHLYDSVVEPRLELFADLVEDSLYIRGEHRCRGVVAMNRERRYAASIELGFDVTCDGQIEHVLVPYYMRIIPILIQFERQATLSIPLADVTDGAVASFVDSKLESAMQTFVEVTRNPFYQREHIVSDPVCGMTFHEDQAVASIEHGGRNIYFCAMTCKERFEANPDEYSASL